MLHVTADAQDLAQKVAPTARTAGSWTMPQDAPTSTSASSRTLVPKRTSSVWTAKDLTRVLTATNLALVVMETVPTCAKHAPKDTSCVMECVLVSYFFCTIIALCWICDCVKG
jgi:hypothetical protein